MLLLQHVTGLFLWWDLEVISQDEEGVLVEYHEGEKKEEEGKAEKDGGGEELVKEDKERMIIKST